MQSKKSFPRALRALYVVLLATFALTFTRAAHAAPPLDPKAVPEPLKPWTAWVLDGSEESTCPTFVGRADVFRCAWPARLDLSLDDKGGHFSQAFHVDVKAWVKLPGDDKRWPLDVTIDGKKAVVAIKDGLPSIEIDRGDHTVAGAFAWDSLPESIHLPAETGLLKLTVRGALVATPNRDAQGTVWLQKTNTNEEGDALEIIVHRKLTDEIPQLLTTRIELHVSGKNREVLLGKAMPAAMVPLSTDSVLPARIEPDGHVRVQVRPGIYVIEIVARGEALVNAWKRPAPDGPWRAGDEVWVFEAKNDDRVVTVEGVTAIDPQQTTLPDAWKRLPAYPMKLTDTLTLTEKRRGDADPPPDQLALTRNLWLDFDGTGYTASDTIMGVLNRETRLTMAEPTVLGRVSISGKDQFITTMDAPRDANGTGVEVRQGHLVVNADSRIPGSASDIPAVSWAHDFHQVSGTLNLPPGWRLLSASGVDEVPGTWVKHWSLLELFLGLIVAIAIGRMHGIRWGVVAIALLALTFPEDAAPKWTWLLVVGAEAIFLVVPAGKVKSAFAWARAGSVLIVALVALPFVVQHVREGMYPALANADVVCGGPQVENMLNGDVGATTIALPMGGAAPQTKVPAAPPAQPAPDMAQNMDKPRPAEIETGKGEAKKNDEDRAVDQKSTDGRKQGQGFFQAPQRYGSNGWNSDGESGERQSNANVYDPTAIVQTGPGLPRWSWNRLDLKWSGPVEKGQRLHLYLLSPTMNLALAFVRAILLIIMILRLFPWTRRFFPGSWGGGGSAGKGGTRAPIAPIASAAATATLAAMFLIFAPSVAHADTTTTPSKETLDELRNRLLRKPECLPNCASSGRMTLDVTGGVLTLRMDVDASAATAVPLPGAESQWTPSEVLVDGKPAPGLARFGEGVLYVEVTPGSHQLIARGALPLRESVQLALHLKPHHVERLASEGWTVEGLHEDGLADDNLQLTRIRTAAAAGAALAPGALPPFVRVERSLRIGLDWQVDTRVIRVSPAGSAVVLEVPLLPGESVTTADVRVVAGKALVNMGPRATEVTWHSVLEQKSPLVLSAPKNLSWVEVWRTDVGPVWHASYSGIPAVHTEPADDVREPTFRPWPGEIANVVLTRPQGVPGQTLTIDSTDMDVRPGLRATDVTLTLSVRSSRGAEHTIKLPEGATLESLSINGASQPIRQEGRGVTIAVSPGAQTVVLVWREPQGISPRFGVSSVDIGAPSVNTTTTIEMPSGRWLLFAMGPRVGPAVLFWSLLLVLVVVSIALGKNRWTPLRSWHWLLLAIGLSQVHVALGALFVLWLIALGWRAKKDGKDLGYLVFNLRQMALVIATVTALTILGVSIYQGLLGAPEMQVRGNGSSDAVLRWFEDRSDGTLATPWIISVPILVYRLVMLAWALWTALALVRWLRWGWSAFTTGGVWKKTPPAPPAPPRPVPVQGPYQQQPYPYPQQYGYAQPYPQPDASASPKANTTSTSTSTSTSTPNSTTTPTPTDDTK